MRDIVYNKCSDKSTEVLMDGVTLHPSNCIGFKRHAFVYQNNM